MTILHMTYKLVSNNTIIGCIATDGTNTGTIPKSQLRNYKFDNAKITSDNKIIGDIPIKQYIKDVVTLYHGSHSGIKGNIVASKSRSICDFGLGFYAGNKLEQAIEIISEDNAGKIYTLEADLRNLKVYKFQNDVQWALYVAANRCQIDLEAYPKLKNGVEYLNNNYDVIVGHIADDRMMYIYNKFINSEVTDVVMIKALQCANLGMQYVFKNDAACKRIKLLSMNDLSKDIKDKSLHNKHIRNGSMVDIVNKIQVQYANQGRRAYEFLEKYK